MGLVGDEVVVASTDGVSTTACISQFLMSWTKVSIPEELLCHVSPLRSWWPAPMGPSKGS